MSVVGVDLGFKNSVIAAAGRGGVDVILNGNSNRLNPSMIGFGECRKMGEQATTGVTSNFKNTIQGMKRLMGLPFDSPIVQTEMTHYPGVKFVPFPHKGTTQATVGVQVDFAGDTKVVPIEHVAGMMIHHMGTIAANKAAEGGAATDAELLFPQDWVVAIPAYWTDSQRRALLAGCEMVGVTGVQRLMHENTATALAYGIFKDLKKEFSADKPTNVMFIDMGASAYTVSIAAFEPGKLKVLSSCCDPNLGGRDFDLTIGKWVATKFEEKFKGKLSAKPMERPKTRIKILTAAEKAKKTLSPQGVKEARIHLEMLQDDFDFSVGLTATDYEAMSQPLLDRLAQPIQQCLEEAKLQSSDLSKVEIVGGSTRIGCVKRKLLEILKVDTLSTTMNADEAVARGAALQSAILSPRFKVLPYDIQEAQPYPIQISWDPTPGEAPAEGEAEAATSVVMFERNMSFPVTRRVTLKRQGTFSVVSSYDSSAVQTYKLPAELAKDPIATFEIKAPAGEIKKVRVNVKQDIHGIIHLSSTQMVEEVEEESGEGEEKAEEEKKKKITKTSLDFTISRPLDWAKEEVTKSNEVEVAMANTDRLVRETSDMRNELESYIYDMRDKIISESHLGPYGTEEEKKTFTAKNEEMENWLYEDGFDATKKVYADKLAILKKLGGPLERRMVEANSRPAAINSLKNAIESYKKWANDSQNDAKFAHITDVERQSMHKACDDALGWLYEMLDKQGALALHQDPALTTADLQAKYRQVSDVCGVVMRKPVPAPKKEEPKPEAPKEPKPSDPPAGEGGGAEPMDVDESKKEGGDDGMAVD